MGLSSREVTPQLTHALIHLVAEVRSFKRAETTVHTVLGQTVSASTIRRLANEVGQEIASQEQCVQRADLKQAVVPEVAIASCDGGRIRTRKPGGGRGVRLSGENGWRETKNASFERMAPNADHLSGVDPCPTLPTSFRVARKVANIAEKPAPNLGGSNADELHKRVVYKGPHRILRTAVSSMACSDKFGQMMKREALRRRFYEASVRAFLGDGLHWNWAVWKKYFPTFVPILDFIHAIQYVFNAAMAIHPASDADGWAMYVRFVTLCWQGNVESVIEELTATCRDRGMAPEDRVADDDPRKPIHDAIRYLNNNKKRMDYPAYRRQGLPVTSAPMESLIKQINMRVKGTEMFWEDPSGAEAILHIRAAALSDDGRLGEYLARRAGCPFQRRTTQATIAA